MRARVVPPPDLFDMPEEPKSGPRLSAAAEAMARWVQPKIDAIATRKARPFRATPAAMARARAEMDLLSESGDWSGARPAHLVALYGWMHRAVYGVEAAELDGKAFAQATAMAGRFIEREFAGKPAAAVEFIGWVWKREAEREKFRRENGREGGRIGWRLQFGPHMLTDYRLSLARRSGQ